MGFKDTPKQESQVRTLLVMTKSDDQLILCSKNTPSDVVDPAPQLHGPTFPPPGTK